MPVESYSSNGVQLGDVDGDNDLDIFVANSGKGPNGLYLNNGAGAFSDASSANLPPGTANYSSIGADFGDVDGDGDLDIAFATNSGDQRGIDKSMHLQVILTSKLPVPDVP